MNPVFADTLFWIALINPLDQWHERAAEAEKQFGARHLVTTDSVLLEILNYFSSYGSDARLKAVNISNRILGRADIETVEQTRDLLLDGLRLYEGRLDKGYSLTDCISMNVMRARDIDSVLTHDNHFTQEGFTILL
jgi:uncharacterized protein